MGAPTAFLQAVIKSGGTKGDCRTFATTTISDIETAVSSQQGVLNAIDNGDGCAAMGQTLVTSTKAAVVSAQAALTAKNIACTASVDFSVGLETLEANSCYDYTSQTGYTQAKASCVAATSAMATADAAVVTAQTVVTDAQATAADAVAEAARLESGCLCRVHQEQAAAQVAVQAATATNAADWKRAHEVLCAVEQTAPCPVPSCPTVEQPTLADGVDNADTQHCTAAPTAEPTDEPTATPTDEPTAAPTMSPTAEPPAPETFKSVGAANSWNAMICYSRRDGIAGDCDNNGGGTQCVLSTNGYALGDQIGLRTPLMAKGTAKISAAQMQHARVSFMGQRALQLQQGCVSSSQASHRPQVLAAVQDQERRGIVATTIQFL